MPVEVHSYRLTLRGKPVGTHTLRTQRRGEAALLEGRTMLQGNLGQSTVIQQSRCHNTGFFSYRFLEETKARGGNRRYEVVFDSSTGMIRASRGQNDRAYTPYLLPYRDPLSMLHEIRRLSRNGGGQTRIPMLGKEIMVLPVGVVTLPTPLGDREAWAFSLYPGRSFIYVDAEPPHPILRLTQRLTDMSVDALLVKTHEETPVPNRERPTKGGGGRKRRRRRSKSRS